MRVDAVPEPELPGPSSLSGGDAQLIEKILAAPSDAAGARAYAGFRWQAKIAVLRWLSCLGSGQAPTAVVCEQVDDLVVVFPERLIFEQLKTKDRGSWSMAAVLADKGGLDSLVRSYASARAAGLHKVSEFELSLEGSMGIRRDTEEFFADPRTATRATRGSLVAHGLPKGHVTDFLARLRIRTGVPPRATIDAVLEQTVGALWPSMTYPDQQATVRTLVALAEAAQAHDTPAAPVVAAMRSASGDAAEGVSKKLAARQVLSRQSLVDATPPLASISSDEVLRRLSCAQGTSALELKLLAAGATAQTVAHAKRLRAQAEVKRQQVIASGLSGEEAVRDLEDRVLMVAGVKASQVHLHASAPGVQARPADFVFGQLMGELAALSVLDHEDLLGGQALLVLGLLCQVSDECRFWWRP